MKQNGTQWVYLRIASQKFSSLDVTREYRDAAVTKVHVIRSCRIGQAYPEAFSFHPCYALWLG